MSQLGILLPLDGSQLAETAIPVARDLAMRMSATITLATVIASGVKPPSASPNDRGFDPQTVVESATANDLAEGYLVGVAAGLRSEELVVSTHLVPGRPADGISTAAREAKADLIVMTTHGRSGFARGILGSVTDRVVLESSIPVCVVRADNAGNGSDGSNGSGESANIVVPLDGSEHSEASLVVADSLSRALSAPVKLVRSVGEDAGPVEIAHAGSYLDAIARKLEESGLDISVATTRETAVDAVIAEVKAYPGTLVVMATRGATGATRLVRGSVADELIHKSPAPVIVISSKDKALVGKAIQ
jgi:nucleotide-binding universal stress UspA family protein